MKLLRSSNKELKLLQSSTSRDLMRERALAQAATAYVHQRSTGDFTLRAGILATHVFTSKYYPLAWLNKRDDLRRIAVTNYESVQEASRLETKSDGKVDTYFYGFELGIDLGYPDEMGEKWYIHSADSTANFYTPIDAIVEIGEIRF